MPNRSSGWHTFPFPKMGSAKMSVEAVQPPPEYLSPTLTYESWRTSIGEGAAVVRAARRARERAGKYIVGDEGSGSDGREKSVLEELSVWMG